MLLSFASLGFGQTALATVTGTITDSTGAVIADAPVTLRNHENGTVFTAASSTTGNYTVAQLPIGDYDLTIAVTGFKTYNHSNFHLAAAQTMREDVTLEIGQTTESVTVTADASLLKTESSEVSQNVTLSQLNNLPILVVGSTNSGFRDPFASVRLVPGIRYAGGSNVAAGAPAPVTTMVVNGTPANTYGTRLDGLTINPTGPRLLGAQMQTQPSVDAVQEVAIETSNFAAEFGTAGGAMINMTTKSGTNAYHGSAYDYITNEALNAHQPYTGTRAVVKQNDWGYTVGGPVQLPKIYDGKNKTFFFFSYEQFRATNINVSNTTTVPLPAYRNGDFSNLITAENRLVTTASGNALDAFGNTIASGTIFDPSSTTLINGKNNRLPFVGNKIPLSSFDPIAVKVLALVPQPLGGNAASGQASNNYQGTFDSSRKSAIPSIKFDHNINSKMRMSIYYQDTHTKVPRTPTGADAFADNITESASSVSSGQTIRANLDYTLSPRLILHLGAGWNDSDFGLEAAIKNYNALQSLGLKGATVERYFPRIVTGVNANNAIGGLSPLGQFFPTRSMERRPSATASATYVSGSHTYKLGSDWRIEKFPNIVYGNVNGTYNFGTNMTEQPYLQGITTNKGFQGYEFASFLLGGMSSNTLAAPTDLSNNKAQFAMYLQDTWKVTKKLTLDYGLRWDYGTYTHEQYGRNNSIGLNIPNPAASGRLGASQFEANCGCKFANNYMYAVGPRLGAAYQIDRKTVLRAGWGIVYNSTSTPTIPSSASASSDALTPGAGQITGLFANGMPSNVVAVWPSFSPAVGQANGTVIAMPTLIDPNMGRPARLVQWNIGLQREISRDLVVEASYIGNRGVWWSAPTLATLNQLSVSTLQHYGFTDFTSASDSALLTTNVGSLTAAQKSTLAARGVTGIPYANFPINSQNVRQSLRDYPQYNTNGLLSSPLGNTWYDSFQLNTTKRFSHGVSLNLNYNYSKTLDNTTTVVDVYNRGLSKNLSVWDLPHQLRLTVQYQVPQLKTSGLKYISNPVVSNVLSGWGIGAYLSYQSAPLVGRPSSNGTLPISNFLGTGRGPGGAQLKQNPDGTYMNPWSVDWYDYSGTHHTDPIDINCHCFDVTKTQILNPAAWDNIPNGQFGAQQGSMRDFRGFRQPAESANFSRNFRFGHDGRVQLNVRVEFNNVFNRMQYGTLSNGTALGPITLGNFATSPTHFGLGPNGAPTATTGLISGGFGTVVPTAGTGGQRTGSLVGRITF